MDKPIKILFWGTHPEDTIKLPLGDAMTQANAEGSPAVTILSDEAGSQSLTAPNINRESTSYDEKVPPQENSLKSIDAHSKIMLSIIQKLKNPILLSGIGFAIIVIIANQAGLPSKLNALLLLFGLVCITLYSYLRASYIKQNPQWRSIEFLKMLEKQGLAPKAQKKVQDAIEILKSAGVAAITLGGTRSPSLRIKLLTPVNTAVRLPFVFKWKTQSETAIDNCKGNKTYLKIFEAFDSQNYIFQEEVKNTDFFHMSSKLEKFLAKGKWYKWRIEIFDEKGELLVTSTNKENEVRMDPEFQIFADEEILKSLKERCAVTASNEDKTDIVSHLVLGAIYQSFQLHDDAVREFRKTIEKRPKEPCAYEKAMMVLQQQELFEEVVQLRKMLKNFDMQQTQEFSNYEVRS